MICSKCGKVNSDDSSFCIYCGNKLQSAAVPPVVKAQKIWSKFCKVYFYGVSIIGSFMIIKYVIDKNQKLLHMLKWPMLLALAAMPLELFIEKEEKGFKNLDDNKIRNLMIRTGLEWIILTLIVILINCRYDIWG